MSVAHGWAAATRRGRSSTLSPLSLGGRGGGRGRSLRLVQRVQNLLSVHAVSHGDEVLSALAHRIETRSALPPRQGPRQLNDRDSGLAGAASTRMCHRSSGAGPPHGRVRRSGGGGAHRCFTPSWSVIDLLRKAMPTMSTPAPALTSRVSHARERTVVAMVPARGSTVARLGSRGEPTLPVSALAEPPWLRRCEGPHALRLTRRGGPAATRRLVPAVRPPDLWRGAARQEAPAARPASAVAVAWNGNRCVHAARDPAAAVRDCARAFCREAFAQSCAEAGDCVPGRRAQRPEHAAARARRGTAWRGGAG